jgi:hypothetical protein
MAGDDDEETVWSLYLLSGHFAFQNFLSQARAWLIVSSMALKRDSHPRV